MSTLLIKNGRVIDTANKIDKVTNVFVQDGKIKSVGTSSPKSDMVIDAKGLIVTPGLIDMHVHLREPGKEDEETVASGASAAIDGGFTSVACMPNTDPAIDNEASAEFVYLQAKRAGKANVFPIGAVTKGRKGEELSEMGQLFRGGAIGFSDDGDPIKSTEVMRRALEYSKMFDKPIIDHCEDIDLARDGVMNEGTVSVSLGLVGMPAVSEEIMVYRDITLARMTGGRLHIAHITTKNAVELIRQAKKDGVRVTAEVTPHHLILTDEYVKTSQFDTNYKVNPPLRTRADVLALREGLADGTIDAIASDHAPHSEEEKDVEFNIAPFGMIGMESLLGVVLSELVAKKGSNNTIPFPSRLSGKVITLNQLIASLTINPARILGIPKGTLSVGSDADITIIDLNKEWTIDPAKFKSKSRNCPFGGWKVKGKAVYTIVAGQV
ncbi:MAG: dihydroorotase, partial [Planctomycetota bacterium]|nr:dihydroorotase [Planctomycetota bacterium]